MYTVKKIDKSKYEIRIELNAEEWEHYVQHAYEETKDKYSVQGFRKGKAPRKVIEQVYGPSIFYEDAVDHAFSHEYFNVLTQEKEIEPIADPEIKLERFDKDGLVFVAVVEVVPEVELGQYKGLTIEKSKETVDEEKVEKELNQVRERQARYVAVEREAKNGDIVTIDFVGMVDGVKFDGGSAENYRLELGSKTFIDNFEEQIEGMKIGEKREVHVTFPENYGAEQLAGKKAVFEVLLTKVEEKQLPELNDEFASDVSEFETLEEYKNYIRKNLQATLDEKIKRDTENKLLEEIVKNSKTEVPQVLVDRQLDLFIRDFETRLSYQGVKLEDYLKWTNTTIEDIKKDRMEQAKEAVKTRLVLEKLVEVENLEITDEEFDAKVKELADKYKKPLVDYKKSLGEKQLAYFKNEFLMQKIFDFLMKHNTIK